MAYWLMKSEPACYGIDHLERAGKDMWEGCRNYTVRNYLRDSMKPGDLAFFHHSNSDPCGVAGILRIVGDPYPDPTQFDPASRYFDPKSTPDRPRWIARDVEFVQKFPRVISMAEMRAAPGLENMAVLQKGQRLSVLAVSEAEWHIVLGLL